MYYENGLLRLFSSDIPKKLRSRFLNATRAYGWKHISQGVWAAEECGNGQVSIEQWLDIQQSHITAGQLIKALGLTREGFSYKAKLHGLESVIKGKYKPQDVATFLRKLGRYAPCPSCGGMGVNQDNGEVICLSAKEIR